jgi:hypothetical protein
VLVRLRSGGAAGSASGVTCSGRPALYQEAPSATSDAGA